MAGGAPGIEGGAIRLLRFSCRHHAICRSAVPAAALCRPSVWCCHPNKVSSCQFKWVFLSLKESTGAGRQHTHPCPRCLAQHAHRPCSPLSLTAPAAQQQLNWCCRQAGLLSGTAQGHWQGRHGQPQCHAHRGAAGGRHARSWRSSPSAAGPIASAGIDRWFGRTGSRPGALGSRAGRSAGAHGRRWPGAPQHLSSLHLQAQETLHWWGVDTSCATSRGGGPAAADGCPSLRCRAEQRPAESSVGTDKAINTM